MVENAKISSLVKQVFTLDPLFKKEDLDGVKLPRTNLRPEMMQQLPRVIYHSCDRFAMEKIIEHGLIPGGWPQRTGRAHNFFIASHPWDDAVGGKKLARTRAGKQYYFAFDTAERRERLEERRVRRKKMQMREKVGKSRNTVFFPMIWGSGGSKSRLAKAAGAEPAGQMREEKLHAVVVRSTFASQNVQNTPASDHFY